MTALASGTKNSGVSRHSLEPTSGHESGLTSMICIAIYMA